VEHYADKLSRGSNIQFAMVFSHLPVCPHPRAQSTGCVLEVATSLEGQ
jgi:hypothetical protein